MFNANSIVVQNMINSGQLDATSTQMYYGTPPAVTYNNYDYGQTNMVPLDFMNPPQQQGGYVFQPISYSGQPQYNYYDPYGSRQQVQQQQWYGYNNYQGYPQQQVYGNYNPYVQQYNMELKNLKRKCQIAGGYFGIEYTDQELDDMFKPKNQLNEMSEKEREVYLHTSIVSRINSLYHQPQRESMAEATRRCLRDLSNNIHKELDNHSMFEFFQNDLWKFQREYWLEENIGDNRNMRDLSKLYSSKDYNDLLRLHQASNPFISQLLSNQYDNNLDDNEIASIPVLNGQQRVKNLLEGKVPDFISSPEVQKQRHAWTESILAQIYNKGGGQNVQSVTT